MKTNTASAATLNTGQDVTLGAIVTGGTVAEVLKAIVTEASRLGVTDDHLTESEEWLEGKDVYAPHLSEADYDFAGYTLIQELADTLDDLAPRGLYFCEHEQSWGWRHS